MSFFKSKTGKNSIGNSIQDTELKGQWFSIWGMIALLQTTCSVLCAHAEVDATPLDSYLKQRGYQSSSAQCRVHSGDVSQKKRDLFAVRLAQLSGLNCIAEVGFNTGHTSEVFLEYIQGAQLVSFDTDSSLGTRLGVAFIKDKYKNRFSFVEGDSLVTVPRYFKEHPGADEDGLCTRSFLAYLFHIPGL